MTSHSDKLVSIREFAEKYSVNLTTLRTRIYELKLAKPAKVGTMITKKGAKKSVALFKESDLMPLRVPRLRKGKADITDFNDENDKDPAGLLLGDVERIVFYRKKFERETTNHIKCLSVYG